MGKYVLAQLDCLFRVTGSVLPCSARGQVLPREKVVQPRGRVQQALHWPQQTQGKLPRQQGKVPQLQGPGLLAVGLDLRLTVRRWGGAVCCQLQS